MTVGPRSAGHAKARLLPERRERLRGLVASLGHRARARHRVVTLGRAEDPYALLPESTIRRLDAAIDRFCAARLRIAG